MTHSNAVNETEIMKKITLLTLIIITLLAAAGCRRSKSNGKIDGFWRISTIEMTQTGEIKHPEDYFIRTQLEITQWPGLGTGEINYNKKEGKLGIDFRDPANPSAEKLGYYGIKSNPTVMDVEFPRHNKMLLHTDDAIITCYRY